MWGKAIIVIFFLVVSGPLTRGSALDIRSSAAIVMDVSSGRILYGKNIHESRPIASLTKKMTALLAAESGRLDELVKIEAEWINVEPSNIWLVPGETITLRNLVYGLMLRSGNDAASSIASFLAGGMADFAVLMNRRAMDLGAKNTNFVNPHGLDHPDHVSTAYDLALIARAVLTDPFLRVVVQTERHNSGPNAFGEPRIWHNKNRLLQIMEQADGLKTAWTLRAGHCLASSATIAGWQLICIVLDSPSHYDETMALLSWGFANYYPQMIVERGVFKGYVRVLGGRPSYIGMIAGEDFWWARNRDKEPEATIEAVLRSRIKPPIKTLDVVGELLIHFEGENVGRVPLLSDRAVRDSSWWRIAFRYAASYIRFIIRPLAGRLP